MEDTSLRMLPSNVDVEAALLGCLLNDGKLYGDIEGFGLLPEDFSQERHAAVFRTIKAIFESQRTPDALTVIDEFAKIPNPPEASFVFDLAKNAPIYSEDTLQQYCSIILEKSLHRSLIGICSNAIDVSYGQKIEFDELSDQTTNELIALGNRRHTNSVVPFKTLMGELLERIQEQSSKGSSLLGISSGYPRLDSMCSGLKPGDMVIVAGRPGMGKTGFAINMALAIAKQGLNVLFFSLEMPAQQILNRFVSIECSINSKSLLNAKFDPDETNRLWGNFDDVADLPIFIDESSSLTIPELRSKAKKLDAELRKTPNSKRQGPNKLDCIFIDYLQLMDSNVFKEDKVRQVEYNSKNIKKLAKDLGIPIIAMAQLNRKIEERRGGKVEFSSNKPMLSDLKDSGSIEQDADMVMFIHREDAYRKKEEEKNNEAEIFVEKNRHGPTGSIKFRFVPHYMKFLQLDPVADSYEQANES
ncbi:replicative DNA helicase [bacterium]|nr:replicative DNA helicase [bacterium]